MKRLVLCLLLSLMFSRISVTTRADEFDGYHEAKVIFAKHCTSCHGETKQESGLRLDLGGGVLRGGDGGPILVASNVAHSRLLRIIKGDDEDVERMPPEGDPLDETEIAKIEAWIAAGAKVPESELIMKVVSDHWAFQRPTRPRLPSVLHTDSVRNAIDHFILARLQSAGISPSPAADRTTLIRRVSLDLLGLPPTPRQVQDFVTDRRPDAYQRLVDRLLASPAYGERWGRHWLDQARYADSNGFTRDFGREIWKYREWVIAAFNAGMPFDRFTIEQFAGDMLPEATLAQRVATGFHRNTLINEEGGTDPEQFRVDAVADRVATTGVVYLGLTLGCARCHQHKYDPISQREYYQVFAFLNNCEEPTIDVPSPRQIESGVVARRDEIRRQIQAREESLAGQQAEFAKQQLAWEATLTPEFYRTLPGPTQAALDKETDQRDEPQKQLIADLYKTTKHAQEAFPEVREIAELKAREPKIPTSMVLSERPEPRETHIHRRGNFLDWGDKVDPQVPSVMHSLAVEGDMANRLDFARWLVDDENPLTPRVIVNRYWQRFFGKGLVETENDFGTQGSPPTHPQLLDWLAVRFVESGWDVKAMHRLIVNSATYRQASRHREELVTVDPMNKLLARQSRIRLDAEIIRDCALAASRLLASKIGGPSVNPPQPEGIYAFTQDPKPWDTDTGENRYRRGMYTFFWRSSPYPALVVFDAPNANVTCTRRVRSNTPLQSLTLANDAQFIEAAGTLAREILDQPDLTESARAELLFRRCLARRPNSAEQARLRDLISGQQAAFQHDPDAAARFVAAGKVPGSRSRTWVGSDAESHDALRRRVQNDTTDVELAAWTAAARVLMNLDEFVTRE